MHKLYFSFLLTIFLCITGTTAFAHDIQVKNSDGVTIYYVRTNNNKELAVSYMGNSWQSLKNHYSGNVVIPETVTYNGNTYSVTSIEGRAFTSCSSLTSITIPNSVTKIGMYAFYGCSGLTSIIIPNSVASIEYAAYENCSGLTSVMIPSSVTSIEHGAFRGCTGLTSITIPNSVTSIGSSAFRDCTGLTSVTIPNSVTSIGASAFYYCTGLTSITIPNSVTSIGSNAFFGCESLTSITIPNSVRVIGYGAFYGCKGLKTVYSFSDTYFSEDVFCYEYWGPTSIEFPSILDTNLQSATLYVKYALINDFKRSWRNFGFYKSLDATSFNGVIYLITDSVNNYAQVFKADKPNNVINIEPSIEIFGSLYKVTSIADNVFKDVESITSLVIPESVKDIGNNAFSGCRNLVTVELGKNVTTIGERAFANIDKLTDLVIPENVKDIGNNAFSGCRNLVTIELGKNVTTIGERAFANIDKLTDVICYAENVPETDRTAFENSYIDYVTLHVPAGSVEKYKNSAPWKDFKKIVAISGAEMKYTLTYMVDGVIYKTYELSEGDAITPEAAPTKEGYMFSGWSEIPQTMPSHDVTINGYFEFDTNTTDVILCDNLQCISGSTPILKVGLTNTNEVKLCQFDLQLPVGVTVVTKSNGKLDAKLTERAETHSVSSKQLENGNYRFVISSLDNDSFTGNSGTLMEITLDISSTMEAGEYIVKVINAELSVPDGNDLKVVKPADTESKLTINNYTPGDVNNDGSVSVTDVGCAINYILEQIPSVFVFEAADMNGDNTVSVTDVGMIINLILNDGASSRRRSSEGNDSETSLLPQINLLSTAEGYELRLEDKDAYIGFQFDMALGDDAVINSIQLNGSANDDHLLTYRRLSNGKWRVVCYSPTNSTFSNDDSVLLTITATSSISVSDICLTTSGLNELHPSNLFGMPTGIANVDKTNSKTTFKLYSLGGNIYRVFNMRSGVNSFDGLRPGIYLIDNKKIVIR